MATKATGKGELAMHVASRQQFPRCKSSGENTCGVRGEVRLSQRPADFTIRRWPEYLTTPGFTSVNESARA
jgi:hypothetical protein